jgi:hypothetical protein
MCAGGQRDVEPVVYPDFDAGLHHGPCQLEELATIEILLADLNRDTSRRRNGEDLVDARGDVRAEPAIGDEKEARRHYSMRPAVGELAFA